MNRFFSKNRIEALTDGIFAIAMTILVLNIDVSKISEMVSRGGLDSALWEMFPIFYSYFLGFFLLAILWLSQNKQYLHVKKVDANYLWINLLGLMLISLIPFSTSLISEYGDELVAAIFFHANLMLAGLVYAWSWVYISGKKELQVEKISPNLYKNALYRNLLLPVVAMIAIGLVFLSPDWSSIMYLLIPVAKRYIK